MKILLALLLLAVALYHPALCELFIGLRNDAAIFPTIGNNASPKGHDPIVPKNTGKPHRYDIAGTKILLKNHR